MPENNILNQFEAAAGLEAANKFGHGLLMKTHYFFEHFRDGELIDTWEDENLVTTVGLNHVLDSCFDAQTQITTWYIGLTDASPTPAAGDTAASHAGWAEDQNYSEATRVALNLGTAAAGSIDNSANKAAFSINATTTIGGAFMISVSTKGGSTGTLYGVAAFSEGNRAVVNGDTLNVTVTLTAASA